MKKEVITEEEELVRKIDYAQAMESMWYEEGKRLKNLYKKRYKEEI